MEIRRHARQLSFQWFAPEPTDQFFFAVRPDEETAACVARLAKYLRDENGLKGKPLAEERLHVTLGPLPKDASPLRQQHVLAMAQEAASTVAIQPFEIAFDRAKSFSGSRDNHPLVLLGGDIAGVVVLQTALNDAMKEIGFRRLLKTHTPHMTLLYGDRCIAERRVETIRWTAGEFILVRSLVGWTQHRVVARWPLCGRAPVQSVYSPVESKAAG